MVSAEDILYGHWQPSEKRVLAEMNSGRAIIVNAQLAPHPENGKLGHLIWQRDVQGNKEMLVPWQVTDENSPLPKRFVSVVRLDDSLQFTTFMDAVSRKHITWQERLAIRDNFIKGLSNCNFQLEVSKKKTGLYYHAEVLKSNGSWLPM